MTTFEIRELTSSDSIAELTDLLHRAYARLGEMGLNFTAVDQSEEVTAERVKHGVCLVAVKDGRIVGTLTVERPYEQSHCEHYRHSWIAAAHQFAVEPDLQGMGLGARLIERAEELAREQGYRELAIDTAVPAVHLVDYYQRRGFEPVGRVQWPGKRYESVVLSKRLG